MKKSFENYPLSSVVLSNLFNMAVYALGAYLLLGFGYMAALVYFIYCLYMEFSVMKEGCIGCYYYGKTCFCGKGRLCPVIFKKGSPKVFEKELNWMMFLPSFLVIIFPVVGGIILLVRAFDWMTLVLTAFILPFYFIGNAVVHNYSCTHCKQREINCRVLDMFDGKKK